MAIGIEGSQTISSGTFVAAEAAINVGVFVFSAVGSATVTFSEQVSLRGQVRLFSSNYFSLPSGQANELRVVNFGTLKIGGQANTAASAIVLSTLAESFVNHGLIESQGTGTLVLNAKSFTNSTTGRIKIEQATYTSVVESLGAGGATTSFVNAGSIELINSLAHIMSRPDGLNETWSNTGSIIVDKSVLRLHGSFTSDDVVNVRNTGVVTIDGQMDNTGRTFTFNAQTRRYNLGSGTIRGGTLVMSGPLARIDLTGGATTFDGSYLDGVTLRGDLEIGGLRTDPISGISTISTRNYVRIKNGLTLDGVISIPADLGTRVEFVGAQTVSGGTWQFTPNPSVGGHGPSVLAAQRGGPVVLESNVTIRSKAGVQSNPAGAGLSGNFISSAPIIIDPNAGLMLAGIQPVTGPVVSFVNRGTVTVPATSTLTATRPFTNDGQINLNRGVMIVTVPANNVVSPYLNTGTIDLTGGGLLRLTNEEAQITPYRTADLGTIIDSGGFVQIEDRVTIDNAGATLVIDGTATWFLTAQAENRPAQIVGGTIQVESTAKFEVYRAGILKDVTVNGSFVSTFGFNLVGEVDVNGIVTPGTMQFGHPTLYPGTPLVIRGGEFIMGGRGGVASITGYSTVPTIALDPDAVLRGKSTNASFTIPLTNRGRIIADQTNQFTSGEVFHFTAAPITNEGTLSAVNRSILRINTLAAPNRGVVSATAGSSVQFTNTFSQAETGTTRIEIGGATADKFGLVAVTGEASLGGILEIQFAPGYVPVAGDRYKVLTYASHTGAFSSVRVQGLAAGLIATPQYNGPDMTLVITVG